jgi:predicted ABC-type ATPase
VSAQAPIVAVIAGPNGAGKSTLAPHLLRDVLRLDAFVNADQLALGLSGFAPEDAAFSAGRVALDHMRGLAARGQSFAFETTLATRSFGPWLASFAREGYAVLLAFLWLPSADLAVERVRARVRLGGHDIPEATIRRRYPRAIDGFFRLRSRLTSWRFYDTSGWRPRLVASDAQVVDAALWRRLEVEHGA